MATHDSPESPAGSPAGASLATDDAEDGLFDLNSLVEVVDVRIGTHKVGVRPLNGAAYRWFVALKQAGKGDGSAEMFRVAEGLLVGATDDEKALLTAAQVGAILRIAGQGIKAVEAMAEEIAKKNALRPDVPQASASTPLALTP
jgi:hypothetical protein